MSSDIDDRLRASSPLLHARRLLLPLTLTLLLVAFSDELVDGVDGAIWPLIRDDLQLSYTEIGIVFSLPAFIGNFIEAWLFILADVWRRRVLVLAAGIAFAVATFLVGASFSFATLLAAFVVMSPASGVYINLSQAALMDLAPSRREQNMARWTLAGAIGNAVGPFVAAGVIGAGFGWRWIFVGLAAFAIWTIVLAWRVPFPTPTAINSRGQREGFVNGLRTAFHAARRRDVWQWLVLLELGNLSGDVLRGFLALYFADVVGVGEARAAIALIVWTCVGLPGDLLLLPLLERVRGLSWLRVSMAAQAILLPAMLLVDGFVFKLAMVGLLGLANAGWYAIIKAQLYAALPERSGTVLTLANLGGLAGSLIPLALGAFAQGYGLDAMMWLLLAGPLVMFFALWTTKGSAGANP